MQYAETDEVQKRDTYELNSEISVSSVDDDALDPEATESEE